jgi:signal transduction histidine kinase
MISLTLAKQGVEALLTVADDGIGIALGELPHVFDQFYRSDASRGQQSGSGLGLSIARHIVQLHGGKIWIINNPNGGVTVNIALPLAV